MRHSIFRSCCSVLLIGVLTTLLLSAQSPAGSATSNHVVIISLDGFKASALAGPATIKQTPPAAAARGRKTSLNIEFASPGLG